MAAVLAVAREVWVAGLIAGVVVLFGLLYWLGGGIEADTRETGKSDDWIRKTRD
jgi:hypothetical protein